MFYPKISTKLFFCLVLFINTVLIAGENSENDFSLKIFEGIPSRMIFLSFVPFGKNLHAGQFVAANISKRYLARNTNLSECGLEVASQFTGAMLYTIVPKTLDKESKSAQAKRTLLPVIPRTFVLKYLVTPVAATTRKLEKLLGWKHPDEVRENKKLCSGGRFILKAAASRLLDEAIYKLLIAPLINDSDSPID